jgi:hypothetical protein
LKKFWEKLGEFLLTLFSFPENFPKKQVEKNSKKNLKKFWEKFSEKIRGFLGKVYL